MTIDQNFNEANYAIEDFVKFHGKEISIKPVTVKDRKVSVLFGGNTCSTCGIYRYFDDFLFVLEKFTSNQWLITSVRKLNTNYKVTYVKADFLKELEELKKNISERVNEKIKEFEKMRERGEKELFKELSFCILTANFSATGGIKIQDAIDDGFLTFSEEELERKLKLLGHRFPKARAEYIVEARKHIKTIKELINSNLTGKEIREFLVREVKGLGYKEASHFLRNIGYKDVAIVDRHILRFLLSFKLVSLNNESLTKKRYLEAEKVLESIARKLNVNLAELDLYIWYKMTGKILK